MSDLDYATSKPAVISQGLFLSLDFMLVPPWRVDRDRTGPRAGLRAVRALFPNHGSVCSILEIVPSGFSQGSGGTTLATRLILGRAILELFILKLFAAGALVSLAIRFLLMETESIVAGFKRVRRLIGGGVQNGSGAHATQKPEARN
jgi:hypothetical protein